MAVVGHEIHWRLEASSRPISRNRSGAERLPGRTEAGCCSHSTFVAWLHRLPPDLGPYAEELINRERRLSIQRLLEAVPSMTEQVAARAMRTVDNLLAQLPDQ